jgi:hypothetical protein
MREIIGHCLDIECGGSIRDDAVSTSKSRWRYTKSARVHDKHRVTLGQPKTKNAIKKACLSTYTCPFLRNGGWPLKKKGTNVRREVVC